MRERVLPHRTRCGTRLWACKKRQGGVFLFFFWRPATFVVSKGPMKMPLRNRQWQYIFFVISGKIQASSVGVGG